MTENKKYHRATRAVQASVGTDKAYGSVMPPLYLSSTFQIEGLESRGIYEYSRTRNPNRDELAQAISALEDGCGHGAITSSGMAALALILHLLNPDDLLIAPYDCYGRSYALMRALSEKGHFHLKFVDLYNVSALDKALAEPARMVLIESPSNPVLRISDIAAISKRAKEANPEVLIVCDNTFLSPMSQQPLNLGADIVFHSTTKFLNGHSDVVGGAVIPKSLEILEEINFWNNSLGTIGSPFDSYMTLRGLRTLEIRIRAAEANAAVLAAYLQTHKHVSRIYYPGLPDNPYHALAKSQQDGFGAMMSFELKGDEDKVKAFVKALDLFKLAQSLGGTESLINHPASMTHVAMGAQARAKAGVTDNLLRLSVGIEHVNDLRADLKQAFEGL